MNNAALGNFELRWLTTLTVVANAGSFTLAAQQLHLTQSAVSQQVAALERWAGAQLLRRRPVELTEAGRVLAARHDSLFAFVGHLSTELAQLREGWTGSVHVGGFLSVCRTIVAQAFAAHQREHPKVVLQLSQLEPGPALAALERGDLDVALVFSYGELAVPVGCEAVLVCDEPVRLAVPLDHPMAGRPEVDIDEVDLADVVHASDAWVYPPRQDTGGFRYFGDDFSVVLALVAAGQGIALVPGLAARPTPPGVVLVPLIGEQLPRRRISAILVPSAERYALAVRMVEKLREASAAAQL
jgi:DNA-binding transcriptional LysR family regulator